MGHDGNETKETPELDRLWAAVENARRMERLAADMHQRGKVNLDTLCKVMGRTNLTWSRYEVAAGLARTKK